MPEGSLDHGTNVKGNRGMKNIIVALAILSSVPAFSAQRKWISQDVEVGGKKTMTFKFKTTYQADTCNSHMLAGDLKPISFQKEAIIIADLSVSSTLVACMKPGTTAKELESNEFTWKAPKGTTKVTLFMPENFELVTTTTEAK